jgi:hypothetical protein
MYPVLLFGSIALGASVRYAMRPTPRALAFTGLMWLTCLVVMFHATVTDVAAVFSALEDPARVPDAQVMRILIVGLKESSRPAGLGGIFLTLVPLCVAIGVLRARPGE